MTRFYLILIIVATGGVAFFAGDRLLGAKRAGGWRALSFLSGAAFCFLGCVGLRDAGPDATASELTLGGLLVLVGVVLTALSLFASNRIVKKIISGFIDGI